MGTSRIFRGVAGWSLALSCLALTACATGPGSEPLPQVEPASQATAPAAEPAAQDAAMALAKQQTELRTDLATVGVEVLDTPEGRIKLVISSDLSFGLGSSSIKSTAAKTLDTLAEVLVKHPNSYIEIVGHTDATGSDAVNLPLSSKRAESTRDHLIGRSVSAERFSTQGWGSDQPIADNKTGQGRAMNRRVEVFISLR